MSSNGVEPVTFDFGNVSTGLGGLSGADAQHSLATAFERALVQMNQDALRELGFIQMYCPQMMPQIKELVNYRFHTNPGIYRKIIDAIKAVALHDYHKQVQQNGILGGK